MDRSDSGSQDDWRYSDDTEYLDSLFRGIKINHEDIFYKNGIAELLHKFCQDNQEK